MKHNHICGTWVEAQSVRENTGACPYHMHGEVSAMVYRTSVGLRTRPALPGMPSRHIRCLVRIPSKGKPPSRGVLTGYGGARRRLYRWRRNRRQRNRSMNGVCLSKKERGATRQFLPVRQLQPGLCGRLLKAAPSPIRKRGARHAQTTQSL